MGIELFRFRNQCIDWDMSFRDSLSCVEVLRKSDESQQSYITLKGHCSGVET